MRQRSRPFPVLVALLSFGAISLAAPPPATPAADSWRTAALQQFDRNKDGRLSDAERETMRKAAFAERRKSAGGGRNMMFPPEIVAKYDKDGDGSLDENEGRTAQQALQKMFRELQRKYDANGNGDFEPPEVAKLQEDAAAGLLPDVPKVFLQMLGRPRRGPRSQGPASTEAGIDLRQMDKDGDGRLNEQELQAARAALQAARHPQRQTAPGAAP